MTMSQKDESEKESKEGCWCDYERAVEAEKESLNATCKYFLDRAKDSGGPIRGLVEGMNEGDYDRLKKYVEERENKLEYLAYLEQLFNRVEGNFAHILSDVFDKVSRCDRLREVSRTILYKKEGRKILCTELINSLVGSLARCFEEQEKSVAEDEKEKRERLLFAKKMGEWRAVSLDTVH